MNDQKHERFVEPPVAPTGDRVRRETVEVSREATVHHESADMVDLLTRLTHQGSHLAQEQIHLMQAEVREAAHDVKQAVAAMATAAVVGIAGLGVLLMGISYLVGDAIESVGWGTVIVGVVALIIAAILAGSAKSKMSASNLKPDRTIRTAEDTPDAVTGNMTAGAPHGR